MTEPSRSEIIGSVEKGRPLFRLFFFAIQDEQLVHLDTGCTFEMVMERHVADALGIIRLDGTETTSVTLASGRSHGFEERTTDILWFGVTRRIVVRVPIDSEGEPGRSLPGKRNAPLPDGAPCAIVGTALLNNLRVKIDFVRNRMLLTNISDESR